MSLQVGLKLGGWCIARGGFRITGAPKEQMANIIFERVVMRAGDMLRGGDN